jgi:transposase-like protein
LRTLFATWRASSTCSPGDSAAIESPNREASTYTGNRRIFASDDAALKTRLRAIRKAAKNGKAIHHWRPARLSLRPIFDKDWVRLSAL